MKLDYFVSDKVNRVVATNFIQKYHYSPVMPRLTKNVLGFYLDGLLKGVLTLGWGTQPVATINKMFPGLKSKDYFEIGKMCLSPDLNNTKGAGSQMISKTIRWMKDNTDCLFLYTLADGIMGKVGYVYQASNFYFGGAYLTQVYMMENGEKFHPRSSNALCKENAKFLKRANPETDYPRWLTTDFMKARNIKLIRGFMLRYIYPLNKKAKKLMKTPYKCYNPFDNSTIDWIEKFWKDKDLYWIDATDRKNCKKTFDPPLFTFEDAKYNLKNIEAHGQSRAVLPGFEL